MDVLIHIEGPRIRDRISHGEVICVGECVCVPVCQIYTQISLMSVIAGGLLYLVKNSLQPHCFHGSCVLSTLQRRSG